MLYHTNLIKKCKIYQIPIFTITHKSYDIYSTLNVSISYYSHIRSSAEEILHVEKKCRRTAYQIGLRHQKEIIITYQGRSRCLDSFLFAIYFILMSIKH